MGRRRVATIGRGSRWQRIVTFAVVTAVVAGCGGGDDTAAGPDESDGGDAEPISITVLADVTGIGASYGEPIKEAAEYCADNMDDAYGIDGRPIELNIEDTTSDAGVASSLMNDAVRGDADVVIYGVLSELALTMAPLAQEAGLPMINVQTAAAAPGDFGKYIWRITPPQRFFYAKVAEYLAANRDVKTASVFYITDGAASVELAEEVFPRAFEDAGMDIRESVGTTSSETDLTAIASRLLEGDPDHIQTAAYGEQNLSLIAQLQRAGFEGSIGGTTSLGGGLLSALDDDVADGLLYTSSYVGSDDLDHKSGVRFNNAFQEAVGKQPNTFQAEICDAFLLVQAAVEASGDASREGITTGMHQVQDGGGLSAAAQADPLEFENRDARSEGVVIEWRGGRETLAPGQ